MEDDASLQKGISLKLTKEGHEVYSAYDVAATDQYTHHEFDFAMIDVNLPDGSGLDVCEKLRGAWPHLRILLLTANDTETDMVMGYELGADDYMTKPFSLSVLLSKVNAVRRRVEGISDAIPLGFDPAKQTAVINGKSVSLTRNETRLLHAFLQNAGQILTKEQLIQTLWNREGDYIDDNALAVNIQWLRNKIECENGGPQLIQNIRGVGYRLNRDGL